MAAVIPYVQDTDFTLLVGDVRQVLAELPAESVDCCVTSPPYWSLRDYGTEGQIGLEASPEEFVAEMVAVFRQVRRVLAPHGTLWLNLGDSYAAKPAGANGYDDGRANRDERMSGGVPPGLKPKDLVGIPWRVAFALQADGWYLRADIIWSKPNPMPESVTDRPTKAHEYVFLLSKQPRYFFDQEAVREPAEYGFSPTTRGRFAASVGGNHGSHTVERGDGTGGRNVRSVWEIATQPYPDAHFATFPEALPERCIKAGCPEQVCVTCGKPSERIVETEIHRQGGPLRGKSADPQQMGSGRQSRATLTNETVGWSDCGHGNYRPGVVLDPFIGSGTTALVARRHGRHTIGIELNPEYAELAARRTRQLSLLAEEVAG